MVQEIRLHGMGGQGVVTTAHLLGLAAVRSGAWAHSFPFFSTAQRGGTVRAFVRIADGPISTRSFIYQPDVLVVFAPNLLAFPETFDGWQKGIPIVLNILPSEPLPGPIRQDCHCVDGQSVARDLLGRATISTVMAGAALKVIGTVPFACLEAAIEESFGPSTAAVNISAARAGFEDLRDMEAVAL